MPPKSDTNAVITKNLRVKLPYSGFVLLYDLPRAESAR